MSNKHYPIGEENSFDVNIRVKVTPKSISNYYQLTEEDIKSELDSFKKDVKQYLMERLIQEYYQIDITMGVDFWDFKVETIL